MSALPYLVLWILSFVFSSAADLLIVKKYATIGATRKIFNSIGLIVPAIALVFLSFMNEDHKNWAIGLLIVAVSVNSATYSGFNVNHMDISPNHSGILMGITNCFSNVFSLIAPLVVQVVVENPVGFYFLNFIILIALLFSTYLGKHRTMANYILHCFWDLRCK